MKIDSQFYPEDIVRLVNKDPSWFTLVKRLSVKGEKNSSSFIICDVCKKMCKFKVIKVKVTSKKWLVTCTEGKYSTCKKLKTHLSLATKEEGGVR